jgi:PadR family transcriptional regulator
VRPGTPTPHPRLSAKELLILELLVRDNAMYGLELVAASRGQLKRGTVYVTLGRMEEKGYLTSQREEGPPSTGGLRRRLYQATPLGRELCTAWGRLRQRLVPRFAR